MKPLTGWVLAVLTATSFLIAGPSGCGGPGRTPLPAGAGGGAAGGAAGAVGGARPEGGGGGTSPGSGGGASPGSVGGANPGSSGGAGGDGGRGGGSGGSGGSGGAGPAADAGGGIDRARTDGGVPSAGGCVGDWKAGDYPPGALARETYLTIRGVAGQQGLERQYKVHVPSGYDCRVPTPVVFCLHGLMQTAVSFCVNGTGFAGGSGFPAKSDQAGFILVMPNGHRNSWNGGSCCGMAQAMGLDDVALMKAILAELGQHLNVDPRRVFATGLSNGGYLSYRLACEAADVFTAVAPGAGGISGITCRPARPVSVLDIHGTNDRFVPYSLQASSQTAIATANGCSTATVPATVPASGGDTTCVTRTGCPPGIEVTACTVQGGGHDWFGDPGCGTGAGVIGCGVVGANSDFMVNTTAAWEFFSRLSR